MQRKIVGNLIILGSGVDRDKYPLAVGKRSAMKSKTYPNYLLVGIVANPIMKYNYAFIYWMRYKFSESSYSATGEILDWTHQPDEGCLLELLLQHNSPETWPGLL